MAKQGRQIGGVLTDQPVQGLLEGLAGESPEKDEPVGPAEAAPVPVENGLLGAVVELLLQDGSPDPDTYQNSNNGAEGDAGARLDVDGLAVQQSGDEGGAEDAGGVGEEGVMTRRRATGR